MIRKLFEHPNRRENMYKRIIIPVDLSHTNKGEEMIAKAKALADTGASLYLVHVLEPVPAYVEAQVPDAFHSEALKTTRQQLADIARESGIELKTQVRAGSPASEILAVAEEEGADLILIKSHKPGFQDYFLGSTAAKVVRKAKCSVLVMR